MVKLYVTLVRESRRTLKSVPERYREAVAAELGIE